MIVGVSLCEGEGELEEYIYARDDRCCLFSRSNGRRSQKVEEAHRRSFSCEGASDHALPPMGHSFQRVWCCVCHVFKTGWLRIRSLPLF